MIEPQENVMTTPTLDPRGIPQTFVGVIYGSKLSYDGVPPEDVHATPSIHCVSRNDIYQDAEVDYEQ